LRNSGSVPIPRNSSDNEFDLSSDSDSESESPTPQTKEPASPLNDTPKEIPIVVEFGEAGKSMLITPETTPKQVIATITKAFQLPDPTIYDIMVRRFQGLSLLEVLLIR
jgi:hypothetical protein